MHLGLTGTASLAEELDSAPCTHVESAVSIVILREPSGCLRSLLPLGSRRAERMLVQLRDGRKIIGLMRSFDQFANIVLENAVERVIVDTRFADVPLGLYVIRGENVVLLGEMVRIHALTHAQHQTCASLLPLPTAHHVRGLLDRTTPRRRKRQRSC